MAASVPVEHHRAAAVVGDVAGAQAPADVVLHAQRAFGHAQRHVDDAAAGVDVANDDAGDGMPDILRRHERRVGMIDGDVVEIGGEVAVSRLWKTTWLLAADIAACAA